MKKINFNKKSKFYIVCPSNLDTGGPKDIHQLAFELKRLGKKVFLYYFPNSIKNPVHKNYKRYNIPYTTNIEDEKNNVLIVPEIDDAIEISKKYHKIQKVLWWLSFDFYLITFFNNKVSKVLKSLIKLPYKFIYLINKLTQNYFGNLSFYRYLKVIYLNLYFKNVLKLENFNINLSQSKYQYRVLLSKGIRSLPLYDYIRDEFHEARKKISLKNKKNIICYNPSKSSSFMNSIITDNPKVRFVPLRGYNMRGVINILSKSKIYIDFGFHPGVDHLPREAALLKNCVITNKEGSALYPDTVQINEKFKFSEKKSNLIKIKNIINQIFLNYENELKNFDKYIDTIKKEKKVFKKQIKNIFT